ESLSLIIDKVETIAVWISIDKDVLSEAEVVTNWDQGQMPLTALLAAIRFFGAQRRIVGVDVCGEYSPSQHRNLFSRWESWRDQLDRAVDTALLMRNEAVNCRLLETIYQTIT